MKNRIFFGIVMTLCFLFSFINPIGALARSSLQSGTSIRYGDTIQDEISNDLGDKWLFSGKAGDKISILMDGDAKLDSFLSLYGPDDTILTKDDDSGGNYDALIANFSLPKDGTYTISAKGYGSSRGKYSLSLKLMSQSSNTAGGNGQIKYGQAVSDQVTTSAGDQWSFSGKKDDLVTIRMTGSGGFDSFLELHRSNGELLINDDDGGGNGSSLILNYKLPVTGNYYIVAKGYNGTTGSYKLTLESKGAVSSGSSDTTNAVINYWGFISSKDFATAWDNTTPSFQERKHGGSYSDYLRGYNDMKICSVETANVQLVSSTSAYAVVSADVIYRNRTSCSRSTYKFDHFLVYDRAKNKWLLEGVDYRQAGVSDSRLSEILTIQTQVSTGEIQPSQAERKLDNMAAEVGISGFTWLVRHLPVYDTQTGWHSFDDYAKDLAHSSGVNEDSRLYQDPVGVGVDLMLREYDSSDILNWLGFDY